MEYVICPLIIIFTLIIIYIINASFEYNFKSKKDESVKSNVTPRFIIVFVKENCPYCEELEENISKSNVKYTIIKLTN